MKIRPRVPGCDHAGVGERSYPMSELRGGSQKQLPHPQGQGQFHIQRAMAAQAQEG